jgi:nucleolar protein 14
MGQSLSTLDEFRDEGTFLDSIDDEDEDDGKIDKEIVRDLHFGGFQPVTRKTQNSEQTTESEQQPQRPKTKKEIMEEIIAKSKYFKVPCLCCLCFIFSLSLSLSLSYNDLNAI